MTKSDPKLYSISDPIFRVNIRDKNKLIKVYKNKIGSQIEYNIVFTSETWENGIRGYIWNLLYIIYRFIIYGRIIDIDTFRIILNKNGNVKYINFDNNFSYNRSWYDPDTKHYTAIVPVNKVKTKNNRIIIYINTWNHIYSHKKIKQIVDYSSNKITREKYIEISEYDMQNNTDRSTVENTYSYMFPWKRYYSTQANDAVDVTNYI